MTENYYVNERWQDQRGHFKSRDLLGSQTQYDHKIRDIMLFMFLVASSNVNSCFLVILIPLCSTKLKIKKEQALEWNLWKKQLAQMIQASNI